MSDPVIDSASSDAAADCSKPEVVTKYTTAASITNEVLQAVIDACKAGVLIVDLCKLGDSLIESKCENIYKQKEKIRKGVAFPTCITVNELCANYSPFPSESISLQENDLIKVDLGCHIDGYIAVAAHTFVLTNSADEKIDGRKADVIRAAWTAAEAAVRTITIGASNTDVTRILNKAAEQFKCKMAFGIQSHQMKQHIINGVRAIKNRELVEDKAEPFTFGPNEVYAIDVVVSTSEGKLKESDHRTCVFQRNVDQVYTLKTSLARQFVREVTSKYPLLPFTVRSIENESTCRLGISECTRHGLLQAYPILTEKPNEFIAQFRYTVLLLPTGTKKITGLPLFQEQQLKSDFTIEDPELLALLAAPINNKKKKKRLKGESKNEDSKASEELKESSKK